MGTVFQAGSEEEGVEAMGEGVLDRGTLLPLPSARLCAVGGGEGEGAVLGKVEGECGWGKTGHGGCVFGK